MNQSGISRSFLVSNGGYQQATWVQLDKQIGVNTTNQSNETWWSVAGKLHLYEILSGVQQIHLSYQQKP